MGNAVAALPLKADIAVAPIDVRFGSIADMCSALGDVCFVPIADIGTKACRLLDHLIGAGKQ
jgi:hypothetical protein